MSRYNFISSCFEVALSRTYLIRFTVIRVVKLKVQYFDSLYIFRIADTLSTVNTSM